MWIKLVFISCSNLCNKLWQLFPCEREGPKDFAWMTFFFKMDIWKKVNSTAWLRQNWNGISLLTSKWGLILSICLWWVKLILSPVSYEPAFGLWKAVFIEIQKSNFITVRFLTFEIGLFFGTKPPKNDEDYPKEHFAYP